jgi:hypothetical protein
MRTFLAVLLLGTAVVCASEEEFLPWQELRIVCAERPETGKVDMPLERARSVKFTADGGTANVTFANGDRLHARLALGPLALDTAFGKVTVSVAITVLPIMSSAEGLTSLGTLSGRGTSNR